MFFIPGLDMSNAQSQFCQGREYMMSVRFLTGIKIDHIHDTWGDPGISCAQHHSFPVLLLPLLEYFPWFPARMRAFRF